MNKRDQLRQFIEDLGQTGVTVEYDPRRDIGRESGYLAGVDGGPPSDYLGWNLEVAKQTAVRYYAHRKREAQDARD